MVHGKRIQCSNGDTVEIAKAHGPRPSRVMAWWSHQAERVILLHRCSGNMDRSPRRSACVIENPKVRRCIHIEIRSRIASFVQELKAVRAHYLGISRRDWGAPFPVRIPRF